MGSKFPVATNLIMEDGPDLPSCYQSYMLGSYNEHRTYKVLKDLYSEGLVPNAMSPKKTKHKYAGKIHLVEIYEPKMTVFFILMTKFTWTDCTISRLYHARRDVAFSNSLNSSSGLLPA